MPESRIIHTHPKTGERKPFAPTGGVVRTSGNQAGWRGFILEQHRLPAIETPEFLVTQQIVAMQVSGPMLVEWKERGRYTGRVCDPGSVSLTPASARDALRWRADTAETLVCQLAPTFLAQSVRDITTRDVIEIPQIRAMQDVRIAAILTALQADIESGYSSGSLFGETLATALAVHLVQGYAALPASRNPHPLARAELRRALDYIHDNLATDLSLAEMADAAGLSPSHFARLFRQATGQPPHRYALHARIERAQTLLLQTGLSITAVSEQLGFYDESHFIRHFKRIMGTTPDVWRKK